MRRMVLFALLIGAALPAAVTAAPVTIGTIDTFQSGTTEGWFAGGGPFGAVPPVPPAVVPTGGPGGAGDAFLAITGVGGFGGPGSRLVAMNGTQWAGDYLAGGVGAIGMDLRNLGPSDLSIRLLFENPIPGPPSQIGVTSSAAVLPAGGGWQHVVFPIAPADLTLILGAGPGAADALLAATTILRIIHAPVAGPAEPIQGILGVDNIEALATPVPEPATWLLFALAGGLVAVRARARE